MVGSGDIRAVHEYTVFLRAGSTHNLDFRENQSAF